MNPSRISALIAPFLFAPVVLSAQVSYNVGPHGFNVPEENSLNSSYWHGVKSLVGLDESVKNFMFHFPGATVKSTVDGYIAKIDSKDQKIIGAIYLIDSTERNRVQDPSNLADLWYARNGYEYREVYFDENSRYYFVYEKEGYRGMFHVFSQPPRFELPPNKKDFHIAVCSGSNLTEIRNTSCTVKFLYKPDLLVSFSLSFENLKNQKDVKSFIEKHLLTWMQNHEDPF